VLLADAGALAAEAGRRRLAHAVNALVALCHTLWASALAVTFPSKPRRCELLAISAEPRRLDGSAR